MLRCLLFAMVALGVLTAPAGAAFPGTNGRIVWSSGGDLWTDAGRLTDTPHVEEAQASWSPDGRRIAFRVGTPGAGVPLRIFVMDADGSDRRQVGGSDHHETQPAWSADGTRIVFRRSVVGVATSGDVWSMAADGPTDARAPVTAPGSDERYPAPSPDGARLAFTSTRDGDVELFFSAADGSGAVQVTHNELRDSAPAWSPDAARLAFERGPAENGAGNEIWTMAASGGDERRLTLDDTLDEGPAWSPDGTQIAFTSARDGGHRIFRMPADGGQARRVSSAAVKEESPDWQPVPAPPAAPAPAAAPAVDQPASAAAPAGGDAATRPAGAPAAAGGDAGASPAADPGATDRDRDGLSRAAERRLRTSDLDRDSDDDGLSDGREARMLRSRRPVGHPRRFDTDRDGLSDGVESGVRRPIADPPGPVRGTAERRFRADRDPRSRTNSLGRDTDRDEISDGREDRDRDGRRDRGERDPRRPER